LSRLLFGVSSSVLPAAPFGAACPARVPSLTAASPKVSTHTGVPRLPLRSVLRLSQPLDGLRHLSASRAYCIPQPRAGLLRSGASPDRQPSWLVTTPSLLAVTARALTGMPAATFERLDFEVLLRRPVRSSGSVFSLPVGRSPLRLLPPSGSPRSPSTRFPGPSALDFSPAASSPTPRHESWCYRSVSSVLSAITFGASVSGITRLSEVCGLSEG